MSTIEFQIEPKGPYSLAASASFLMGFTPATKSAAHDGDALAFAFRLDETGEAVAVSLREERDKILCRATGTRDRERVRRQVARSLSLDHDGTGFVEVGRRDPVIGELQRRFAGFRPVCFYSPYEAAVWGILASRMRMSQAAKIRDLLAVRIGDERCVDGASFNVLPAPKQLAELETFPGIAAEKIARLRGIAEAALRGELDAETLRRMPFATAVEKLQTLRGVGPWTAAHIVLRGACVADEPAFVEPRVRGGFALAYGLKHEPSDAELLAAAEAWRPFRTWVSVLLAVFLARSGKWSERPRNLRANC